MAGSSCRRTALGVFAGRTESVALRQALYYREWCVVCVCVCVWVVCA